MIIATLIFGNYYSSYHSVEDIFLKMNLDDSNSSKNIQALETFGKKNDYSVVKNEENGAIFLNKLVEEGNTKQFQQIAFKSKEKDSEVLTYFITDSEYLSDVNNTSFNEIKEGDSLQKAIKHLGISSQMNKNKEGIVVATWLWENQLFAVELTLKNNKVMTIKI